MEDVSERIEEICRISPDADIERMKAIRDAARAKAQAKVSDGRDATRVKKRTAPRLNELGRNDGRTIDNFGPDIDPSSKASVEVERPQVNPFAEFEVR